MAEAEVESPGEFYPENDVTQAQEKTVPRRARKAEQVAEKRNTTEWCESLYARARPISWHTCLTCERSSLPFLWLDVLTHAKEMSTGGSLPLRQSWLEDDRPCGLQPRSHPPVLPGRCCGPLLA